jgi:DNA-binding beta-propeller fold protein YncE/mono/diheme cytochrome c family protein
MSAALSFHRWFLSVSVAVAVSSCGGPPVEPRSSALTVSADPALDPACLQSLNTEVPGSIVRIADVEGPVFLPFEVTLDANSPALFKPVNVAEDDTDFGLHEQQPQFDVASVSEPVADVALNVAIKQPTQRPDLLWMEFFLISDNPSGIRDAKVRIRKLRDDFVVYDLGANLWDGPLSKPELMLGGVAPHGVTKLIVGIGTKDRSPLQELDNSTLQFAFEVDGQATRFAATSSARLALTSDDAEVWTAIPEADAVVVADTVAAESVARIAVQGEPQGMALTPDDRFALTVAPKCNQLVVIDRASREVIQRFGEAEGVGREPHELVLSPDGSRAYVSSYVGDALAIFERRTGGFVHLETLATGRRPMGLSVSPDGGAVFVAHSLPRGSMAENEAWISVYDAESLELLTDQAAIPDGGNPEYTACLQQLPMFADYTPEELMMEGPYSMLRGTYLNPAGTEALVPSMVLVPFLMFEGDMQAAGLNRPLGRITTSNILAFDTRKPAKTHFHQLDTIFDIRDRDLEYQQCVNHNANMEFPQIYYPEDRPGIATSNGAMHPTGETGLKQTGQVRSIAYTRGGRRALLVSYSSDELVIVDPNTHHSLAREHFTLSGNNPVDMVITKDGRTGYVAYANSLYLSVIDTSAYAQDELPKPAYTPFWISKKLVPQASASLVSYGRVTRDVRDVDIEAPIREAGQLTLLDTDPMNPLLRRGRTLFASSNPDKYPELTAHREGGCVICHGDGHNDGSMWVMVDGERRTMSLRGGVGTRGWLKAKATNRDAREVADGLSRELLGGTGLSDYDLDALASYVAWGIPRLQAPATDTELAAAGEELFAEACTACHVDAFTQLAMRDQFGEFGGSAAPAILYDVGTQTNYAGASMGKAHQDLFRRVPVFGEVFTAVVGDRAFAEDDVVFNLLKAKLRPDRTAGEFKAPSLVNVWDNALFFHDGRFHELRDAVQYMSDANGLELDSQQIDALTEYLRTF